MQPDHIDAALVDFGVLADWMDAQALPGGPFEKVERLGGGTQNILVRFWRGDARVRAAPRRPRTCGPRATTCCAGRHGCSPRSTAPRSAPRA